MSEKLRKELDEIFNDPLLDWVNEESVKKMSEVVRDVFPEYDKEQIDKVLENYWEREDTPETLYKKLMDSKVRKLCIT